LVNEYITNEIPKIMFRKTSQKMLWHLICYNLFRMSTFVTFGLNKFNKNRQQRLVLSIEQVRVHSDKNEKQNQWVLTFLI
jgi:hypothetical protein